MPLLQHLVCDFNLIRQLYFGLKKKKKTDSCSFTFQKENKVSGEFIQGLLKVWELPKIKKFEIKM